MKYITSLILCLLTVTVLNVNSASAAALNSSKNVDDFEALNRIPMKLKILSEVSTKSNIFEGKKLVFTTTEDVVLTHKKVLPAGSRVFGTVETISQCEKSGIPANLIIGNFKIEYMPNVKINGQILKVGANRSAWVRFLYPLLFAVKGGQAKILPNEIFEVYYIPKDI